MAELNSYEWEYMSYKAQNSNSIEKKFADPYVKALVLKVWTTDQEH